MTTGESNLIDLEDVFLRHSTEDAYLVQLDDKKVWVPKSQVEYDPDECILTLPEWLAIEKGLV